LLQSKEDIERFYPSSEDKLQQRVRIEKLIEEGLKDEVWSGRRIGEYIIVEEIGRGGMGIVLLTIQTSLNRYVALKILPFGFSIDDKSVVRFQNEAKIIAKFNHPNIVPIFSSGEEEGVYYIAMAFIPGLSLNKVIESLKHFSLHEIRASSIRNTILMHPDFMRFNLDLKNSGLDESIMSQRDPSFWDNSYLSFILTIFHEVADALSYAHRNDIYHGDLKPSNIILTPEGIPMIADFGLAKDMKAIATTRSNEFAGTIGYASPEQIRDNTIDEKSDIWSLGVTLYELINFNHPFGGKTISETIDKILNSEPPSLRKQDKKIPKEVEAIIFKCLEKNPKKRYSSMTMLREDLNNFLESKPIKARPVGIMNRTYKWVKRHPLISLLTFGLLLTLMIASSLFLNKRINDYIGTGYTLYDKGDYNGALYSYNEALNILEQIPFSENRQKEVFYKLGDVWLGKGEHKKAISYYKRAIEIDPEYSQAIAGLGDAYFELGVFDKAVIYYKLAIKLSPDDRYNYYKLGKTLANKGSLDEAVKNYLTAIRIAPKDSDTLGEIASVVNKKGLHKNNEIEKYLKGMGFNSKEINSVVSSKQ
jgi:serine/threonine protein kinase/TolA-binding protein